MERRNFILGIATTMNLWVDWINGEGAYAGSQYAAPEWPGHATFFQTKVNDMISTLIES